MEMMIISDLTVLKLSHKTNWFDSGNSGLDPVTRDKQKEGNKKLAGRKRKHDKSTENDGDKIFVVLKLSHKRNRFDSGLDPVTSKKNLQGLQRR
jgi:hypothetical protein